MAKEKVAKKGKKGKKATKVTKVTTPSLNDRLETHRAIWQDYGDWID